MAASLGWLGAKVLAVPYPEGLGHVNFSSERKNKAACLAKSSRQIQPFGLNIARQLTTVLFTFSNSVKNLE
jgi:hypothetical protein